MRHTRQAVIARTRGEFAKLDRLVARLRPGDWKRRVPRPSTRDPWTVKDALAHIVYWKAHTARVIRGERRLPEIRGLDVNQINRLIYDRWRRRRPSEVVAWHRRVHAEVLRTLASTPAAWFGRRERSPEWPGDLDGHSAAHRVRDIEAALTGAPDH
jgi:Mycothiol maleylpyruvate isomerase N-terminal domain